MYVCFFMYIRYINQPNMIYPDQTIDTFISLCTLSAFNTTGHRVATTCPTFHFSGFTFVTAGLKSVPAGTKNNPSGNNFHFSCSTGGSSCSPDGLWGKNFHFSCPESGFLCSPARFSCPKNDFSGMNFHFLGSFCPVLPHFLVFFKQNPINYG